MIKKVLKKLLSMQNRLAYKKRKKKKKVIDGYYFDGKKSIILYKDTN